MLYYLTIISGKEAIESRGYLAVDFFFMLSGYVMARSYERKFAGGYGFLRFFRDRYRRLWPVMAIGALIGTPMLALELNNPARFAYIALANLFFIPAVAGTVLFPVNAASWSIFAELSANLLHGAMLRRWSTAILGTLAACLPPLLSWVASTHGSLSVGVGAGTLWLGALSFPLYAVHRPIMHWAKGLGLGAAGGVTLSLALAAYIAYRQQFRFGQAPARTAGSDAAGGGFERDGSLRAG